MAPLPKQCIDHFTHPTHPLFITDQSNAQYRCNGCKILGTGKRYRCNTCNFDLHEYCATCPRTLSSFMHQNHALTLVIRTAQTQRQVDRVCDVCGGMIEGLFYRCKECEFDVHPLCTQLPEKLQHALHKNHVLTLQSASQTTTSNPCAVCRHSCKNWRYRCGVCNFDIHPECVLVPVVRWNAENIGAKSTGQRGVYMGNPYQAPPQYANYYGFSHGYYSGYNHSGYHQYGQNQFNHQVGVSSSNFSGLNRPGNSMFDLVAKLGFGVISNMIFGVDLTSLSLG